MENIKSTLLENWNFMRILRLGLSIIILIQAFQMHDPLFGVFGAFFLIQALTNTGCCAGGNCTTTISDSKRNSNGIENVEFEEIKTK